MEENIRGVMDEHLRLDRRGIDASQQIILWIALSHLINDHSFDWIMNGVHITDEVSINHIQLRSDSTVVNL